jgi:hypothetical protein
MKINGLDILTGWNDLKSPLSTGKAVGGNVPTFAAITDSIKAYNFSASTMNELFLVPFHIGHDYKPGSLIFFHMHWSPDDTNTGVVRWGIEYSVSKGHGQQAFPASTTVYLEQAGSGTAKQHQIIEDTVGVSTDIEPDSLILMRIFRDAAHANDTYTGIAWGHTLDAHYQSDRKNTINKTPNFYG